MQRSSVSHSFGNTVIDKMVWFSATQNITIRIRECQGQRNFFNIKAETEGDVFSFNNFSMIQIMCVLIFD